MSAFTRDDLAELLKTADLSLPPDRLALLWRYHELFCEANATFNLTSVTDAREMALKHYVDSMLVAKRTRVPTILMDLGTGPGLPGIPLKIFIPDLDLTLAESRKARVKFLRQVCGELNLRGTAIFPQPVTAKNFPKPMEGVITRALEPIVETLTRCRGFLKPKGRVLFMKGPQVDEELKKFSAEATLPGEFALVDDQTYQLPILDHGRRLVVFERTA